MIISVWGNTASGKSTISMKLALSLAGIGKSVVLIDSNFVVPQLGVWFPGNKFDKGTGLTGILQNEINEEILSHKLNLVSDNLAVLGYHNGEASMNSILQRYDTSAVLLNTASNIADYVIVDCQTNITQDFLTFVSLEMSGLKFVLLTPNLLAVSFWESNIPMLEDKKYGMDRARTVLNKANHRSPISAMEKKIGKFHFILPSTEAVENELLEGSLASAKSVKKSNLFNSVIGRMVYEILLESGGTADE